LKVERPDGPGVGCAAPTLNSHHLTLNCAPPQGALPPLVRLRDRSGTLFRGGAGSPSRPPNGRLGITKKGRRREPAPPDRSHSRTRAKTPRSGVQPEVGRGLVIAPSQLAENFGAEKYRRFPLAGYFCPPFSATQIGKAFMQPCGPTPGHSARAQVRINSGSPVGYLRRHRTAHPLRGLCAT
jgi:hypothetical protein